MRTVIILMICSLAFAFSATNLSWYKLEVQHNFSANDGLGAPKKMVLRQDGSALVLLDEFNLLRWLDAKGKTVATWQLERPVLAMAFQGKSLLVVSGQEHESFRLERFEPQKKPVTTMLWQDVFRESTAVFNKDASGLVVTTIVEWDMRLVAYVWQVTDVQPKLLINPRTEEINYNYSGYYQGIFGQDVLISLSPSRKTLLSYWDKTIDSIDLETGERFSSELKLDFAASLLVWSEDEKQFLLAKNALQSKGHELALFNHEGLSKVFELENETKNTCYCDGVRGLRFTQNEIQGLFANGHQKRFDRNTGKLIQDTAPQQNLEQLVEATWVNDAFTRALTDTSLIDLKKNINTPVFEATKAVAISADQKMLALVTAKNIKLFEVKTGRLLREFKLESDAVCASFSADNKKLAIGTFTHGALVFDLVRSKVLLTTPPGIVPFESQDDTGISYYQDCPVGLSEDGTHLIDSGGEYECAINKLWRVWDHKLLLTANIQFDRSGHFFTAYDCDAQTLEFWQTNKLIWRYKTKFPIAEAQILPDMKSILVLNDNQNTDNSVLRIYLLSTKNGVVLKQATIPNHYLRIVGVSDDSSLVILADKHTQWIIDAKTLKVIKTLSVKANLEHDSLGQVSFSRDNQRALFEFRFYFWDGDYKSVFRGVEIATGQEIPLPKSIRDDSSLVVLGLDQRSMFAFSKSSQSLLHWSNSRK